MACQLRLESINIFNVFEIVSYADQGYINLIKNTVKK